MSNREEPGVKQPAPGARRKPPLGIQTFRESREGGYHHVDETGHIRRLVDGGKRCFLSRPRRFGKSLLLDTIGALFEGTRELFRGLAAQDDEMLSAGHPVVRLDFSGGGFEEPGPLQKDAIAQLDVLAEESRVAVHGDAAPIRFSNLIRALRRKTGHRVVAPADEYDTPILDALEGPELARANRDFLRGLHGAIK